MTTVAEAQAEQYRHELTAFPQVIAGIRRIVGAYVCLWGWEQSADDAALCVSELLSNVRKHADSGRCVLTLRRQVDGVRVTVSDTSAALPVVREPDWEAEEGRGLALVGSVADDWGAVPTATGKDVWFEIRARPRGRSPVCGERALLPDQLVLAALELASCAGPDDVERHLRCTGEEHARGDHLGFVAERSGARAGSVWARWTRGRAPADVVVMADCDATGPDPAHEPCGEYDGHPGGHTWQLADPWCAPAAPGATHCPLGRPGGPAAQR